MLEAGKAKVKEVRGNPKIGQVLRVTTRLLMKRKNYHLRISKSHYCLLFQKTKKMPKTDQTMPGNREEGP